VGRALLEARHKFLNVSGPHIDPYELKTLAQFYILGDPSLSLVKEEPADDEMGGTVENRRINLYNKGVGIGKSVAPSKKIKSTPPKHKKALSDILKKTGFNKVKKSSLYQSDVKGAAKGGNKKALAQGKAKFRTYLVKKPRQKGVDISVLVVKENEDQVLGYRVYVSR
jgi:hypothetical protein